MNKQQISPVCTLSLTICILNSMYKDTYVMQLSIKSYTMHHKQMGIHVLAALYIFNIDLRYTDRKSCKK